MIKVYFVRAFFKAPELNFASRFGGLWNVLEPGRAVNLSRP